MIVNQSRRHFPHARIELIAVDFFGRAPNQHFTSYGPPFFVTERSGADTRVCTSLPPVLIVPKASRALFSNFARQVGHRR